MYACLVLAVFIRLSTTICFFCKAAEKSALFCSRSCIEHIGDVGLDHSLSERNQTHTVYLFRRNCSHIATGYSGSEEAKVHSQPLLVDYTSTLHKKEVNIQWCKKILELLNPPECFLFF